MTIRSFPNSVTVSSLYCSSLLPEDYLVKVPGEGGEEEREGHDEAAHHRGQPGRLPAAERHEERRQQVRQAQVRRAHPH